MKKAGVVILLIVLLSVLVFAQSNITNSTSGSTTSSGESKGYQCLENIIDEKEQADISLQEAIFSTLALGFDQKLHDIIEDEKGNNCWPGDSCTVKETSQVLLAYDREKRQTDNIENWLLTKNQTATELTWYLQIDIQNHIASQCTLSYQDSERTVSVNEDMTLSGNPGSCFAISDSGFWLEVKDNCIGEEFSISCDQDFVTSLLYESSSADTIFVSPNTNSQSSLGTTTEKVNSQCFSTGGACDYEGTLWAALALDKAGHEINSYMPYLLALAEDNANLIPSSFLYKLTKSDDQYNNLIQAQQQDKYWQAASSRYNRFYDTSLAMLALYGSNAAELTNAKNYLLSIQTPEGCWNNNNIRDTAFILYSGWPRGVSISTEPGGTGGGQSCESARNYCVSSIIACANAGGIRSTQSCDIGICCTADVALQSCSAQNGVICSAGQTCQGSNVDSLEGSCCIGTCSAATPDVTECELDGGNCYASCNTNEELVASSCGLDSGAVCCKPKTVETSDSGSSLWVWILVLVILIGLVVLGIVYRNKLQLMFFKWKSKGKGSSTPARGPPPGYPPRGMPPKPIQQRPMQRPMQPMGRPPQMPPRRPASPADKELDETLKKLRDMGK